MGSVLFVVFFGGMAVVLIFASLDSVHRGREQITQTLRQVDAHDIQVVHSMGASGRDHTGFDVSYRDAQGRPQRTTCKVFGYGGRSRLFWLDTPQFGKKSAQQRYPLLAESVVLARQKSLIRQLRVENAHLRRQQTRVREKTLTGYGTFLN